MKVRKLAEDQLSLVAEWFRNVKWPSPPVPKATATTCMVTEDDEGLINCIHLYSSGTGYVHLDWFGESPEVESTDKKIKAMKLLFSEIEKLVGVSTDAKALIYYTQNYSVADLLKEENYRVRRGYAQVSKILEDGDD